MTAINFRDALDTQAAADVLNAKKATLEKWRVQGVGPTYYRVGGRIYYLAEDIQRYAESRRQVGKREAENNAA